MLYLSSFFYLISACCLRPGANFKQTSIDSVFVAWNKATYLSLNREKIESTDSSQRKQYENRIENLKDFFVGKEPGKIDSESLRYRFLRKLFTDLGKTRRGFYIIEADNSGAKILLRNFVVFLNSSHQVSVDVYVFGRDGWFRQVEGKKIDCTIVDGFERNYVKFAHGFNEDDVIITKFENNTVMYSEYFLYGTLAAASGVKAVLATYNTKNFIK